MVRRAHGADTTCKNGLSAAKTARAPIKDKLVVAMPKPRERIQPLTPKLPRRNTGQFGIDPGTEPACVAYFNAVDCDPSESERSDQGGD